MIYGRCKTFPREVKMFKYLRELLRVTWNKIDDRIHSNSFQKKEKISRNRQRSKQTRKFGSCRNEILTRAFRRADCHLWDGVLRLMETCLDNGVSRFSSLPLRRFTSFACNASLVKATCSSKKDTRVTERQMLRL